MRSASFSADDLMTTPLDSVRVHCRSLSDAVRWACILEATAPKAGNVHPSRSFDDLSFSDFASAAEISACAFESHPTCFSLAILTAAERVADRFNTNVNLGILLLLGPLIQAESASNGATNHVETWERTCEAVLQSLTGDDSKRLYRAINVARPGGMGRREELDLSEPPPERFLDAMEVAKDHDRIARNYCEGFRDLFQNVTPLLRECITEERDLLRGITIAQHRLLATGLDSLILRKFGPTVAKEVQLRARDSLKSDVNAVEFDRFLRGESEDNRTRLNPGTTADLIAASLYVLLRLGHQPSSHS